MVEELVCRLSRKKFQAQARSEVQTMKRFSRVVPPLQLNFITNYQLLEANTTMNSATASAESLRKQISATEEELKRLRAQLASVEAQDAAAKGIAGLDLGAGGLVTGEKNDDSKSEKKWPLSEEEYRRYGRQMIVPSVGIQGMFIERELIPGCGKRAMGMWLRIITGQLRLKEASALIVGAGGLGCPAAAYLAGAGIGTIGIVDGDEVETSNLHRQILHSTAKVGMKKVESAIEYLKQYVSFCDYPFPLSSGILNAFPTKRSRTTRKEE